MGSKPELAAALQLPSQPQSRVPSMRDCVDGLTASTQDDVRTLISINPARHGSTGGTIPASLLGAASWAETYTAVTSCLLRAGAPTRPISCSSLALAGSNAALFFAPTPGRVPDDWLVVATARQSKDAKSGP